MEIKNKEYDASMLRIEMKREWETAIDSRQGGAKGGVNDRLEELKDLVQHQQQHFGVSLSRSMLMFKDELLRVHQVSETHSTPPPFLVFIYIGAVVGRKPNPSVLFSLYALTLGMPICLVCSPGNKHEINRVAWQEFDRRDKEQLKRIAYLETMVTDMHDSLKKSGGGSSQAPNFPPPHTK